MERSETINRPVSEVFAFYADDHLQNHPRWDPEMELSLATDGEVKIGTVFNRRHTHFGDPVEGSMTVIEFERDQLFGLALDDGFGEFGVVHEMPTTPSEVFSTVLPTPTGSHENRRRDSGSVLSGRGFSSGYGSV